jgi:hypothetical protein
MVSVRRDSMSGDVLLGPGRETESERETNREEASEIFVTSEQYLFRTS